MAFRNIVIEHPARLSLRNQQLIVLTDVEHSIPLEDISALLLESRQSTITTAALSQLGQRGCAVYICDEKHLPCAVMTPFQSHSRGLAVLKEQLHASEPLKKRLWQSIVQEKIRNQALCLQLCEKSEAAEALFELARQVRSGDSGNTEAVAAQAYFPALFGRGFTREEESGINAALNYGYAVLRGCTARFVSVYGFLPSLGVHHRNELNAFNLADDLMEPFRPIIDLLVFRSFQEEDTLTPSHKRLLFNCLNLDSSLDGKRYAVSYAIEQEVQSLHRSFSEKSPKLLLPRLLELKQHSYE